MRTDPLANYDDNEPRPTLNFTTWRFRTNLTKFDLDCMTLTSPTEMITKRLGSAFAMRHELQTHLSMHYSHDYERILDEPCLEELWISLRDVSRVRLEPCHGLHNSLLQRRIQNIAEKARIAFELLHWRLMNHIVCAWKDASIVTTWLRFLSIEIWATLAKYCSLVIIMH